jgi:predicted HTH transcriptional regulator
MKLTVSPLYALIAEGEHLQQDFKYCINDSRKIAKSLVAFANTQGGRLLVGVKDNGKIAGVRSDEEYYMVEAAANLYSKPKIEFEVQQWDLEGKTVLEITVPPSSQRPHFAENDERKWLAYIRHNDQNIMANSVLLKAWRLGQNPKGILFKYDKPRMKLVAYLQENREITLSKFCKVALINRNLAENILAQFFALGCIDATFEKQPVNYYLNDKFDLNTLG